MAANVAPAIGLFGLLQSLARFLLSMDALVWTPRFIRATGSR